MDDEVESLLVEVRAGTQGFVQDCQDMGRVVDTDLTTAFERAGKVLEGGLLGALKRGSLGFDDLKRIALQVIDQIAQQALQTLFGGGSGTALDGIFKGGGFPWVINNLLGLPGRATGGPVAPGRGYLVGERGPELFVPTSAGRVEAPQGPAREVRVSINLSSPRGEAPQALQRSGRQVASAVRRALQGY